jgi:glycosyltransferase involved in cell wall biosynthesis
MKILMLFPYAPLPPPMDLGGTKRNLPFLLELAKYNEVSVLSFGTSEEQRTFVAAYGNRLDVVRFVSRRPRILNGLLKVWLTLTGQSLYRELYHRSMQRAINEVVAVRQFDVIHCCVQMFGRYQFPVKVPVSSDTHEVKHLLFLRTAIHVRNPLLKLAYYLWYCFSKKDEFVLCNRFELLTTTTDVDRAVFRKHLPRLRMAVVQNGAGASFFEDLGVLPEPTSMVFTGLFAHLPNSEGILYFLREVFPMILRACPDARVYIVGKDPTREMLSKVSERVIVTGFVDDVRPYIARARVFIIPLLAGGGIRGKALEAMAMRRPIVTTSIGVEGIHLKDEVSALFADTPTEFCGRVLRLFRDQQTWQRITDNAYHTALSEYTWESKGKELHAALTTVVHEFKAQEVAGQH